MTESVLPLAWLDELLSGEAIDISQIDMDFKAEASVSPLRADSLSIHDFGRFDDEGFNEQSRELASSVFQQEPAPLAKRTTLCSRPRRPKQRSKSSKTRHEHGVRTDASRRMEIAELKLELPKLEARIDYLMQKAVCRAGSLTNLGKSRLVNDRLREIVHRQRLWIARGMSAISHYPPQCAQPLLDYSIHLPLDTASRIKMLCDLRADILREGREILHERMRFLSSGFLPRYELSSHATDEGDACALVFATTPVEGASSVKDVLDMLREVLTKDQAVICQKTGAGLIAGAVDSHPLLDLSGIANRRRVRLRTSGQVIEHKGVLFSDYQASSTDCRRSSSSRKCSEQATIIIHSVEDDQLHPHTSGWMRLDMTTIISIHHHGRHSERYQLEPSCTRDTKDGIVIVRTVYFKLRRCGISFSASGMRAELDDSVSKIDETVEVALGLLNSRQRSTHESP